MYDICIHKYLLSLESACTRRVENEMRHGMHRCEMYSTDCSGIDNHVLCSCELAMKIANADATLWAMKCTPTSPYYRAAHHMLIPRARGLMLAQQNRFSSTTKVCVCAKRRICSETVEASMGYIHICIS